MENGSELAKRMAAWEKEGDEEVECTLGEDGKGKMQENIRNNKSFFFFQLESDKFRTLLLFIDAWIFYLIY